MIVRELLTTALERANDSSLGHTPNAREFEHARKIFNGRLKKYSADNLISVYQRIKDIKLSKEKMLIGNRFEGKKVYMGEPNQRLLGESAVEVVDKADDIDLTIGVHRPFLDVFFDASQEVDKEISGVVYSPFYTLWPGTKFTSIRNVTITYYPPVMFPTSFQYNRESNFEWNGHIFHPMTSGTIPASGGTANVEMLCDDYVPEIEAGDTLEYSDTPVTVTAVIPSGAEIDRNNSNSIIHLKPDEVDTFVGFRPDVFVKDIDKVVGVNWKDQLGRFRNLAFRNLNNFYVDQDRFLYNARPYSQGLVELLTKEEVRNKDSKLIYNCKMEFGLDDFIDLPSEYEELLTQATIVELLRSDASSDPSQLQEAKQELESQEEQIMSNNASTKMIQRDDEGEYEPSLNALFTGSFLRGLR